MHANDQLDAIVNHFLNQNAVDLRARSFQSNAFGDLFVRRREFMGVARAQINSAHFCLVQDIRRIDLYRNRVTDLGRCAQRILQIDG